jgi:hypothetical protein
VLSLLGYKRFTMAIFTLFFDCFRICCWL